MNPGELRSLDPEGAVTVSRIVVHPDGSWDSSNIASLNDSEVVKVGGPVFVVAILEHYAHQLGTLPFRIAHVVTPGAIGWLMQTHLLKEEV